MAFTTDVVNVKLVMTQGAGSQISLLNSCGEAVRKKKLGKRRPLHRSPGLFYWPQRTEIKATENLMDYMLPLIEVCTGSYSSTFAYNLTDCILKYEIYYFPSTVAAGTRAVCYILINNQTGQMGLRNGQIVVRKNRLNLIICCYLNDARYQATYVD